MDELQSLIKLAGRWQGTNYLWLSPSEEPRISPASASITPVIKGRFIRLDYSWEYDSETQEGSTLLGIDPEKMVVSAVWTDSWHMGRLLMICQGEPRADGVIDVSGFYAAPPGPDWGWRSVIEALDETTFRLQMYNIPPGKEGELAVRATFHRVAE